MANYYGQTRSNYFFVKDADAFLEEMKKFPVEIIKEEKNGMTLYGFLDADSNGGGSVDFYADEDGEYIEVDWSDFFARHLADGWVAVIVSSGNEKYRYISGHAVAYNNKGEEIHLDLSDIYTIANHLGDNITRAEY